MLDRVLAAAEAFLAALAIPLFRVWGITAQPAVHQVSRLLAPEVLAALKISRSTLYAMRKAGVGPKNIKLGCALYFNEESLVKWLYEHEENA